MALRDVRVCFLGDSFVAGVGDAEHLGWVGRIAARSHQETQSLTAYNLGVRRQTTRDVVNRWQAECGPRLTADCEGRVVVSVGVNDATWENGAARVAPADSAAYLARLLREVTAAGWRALAIGPPPISDQSQSERIGRLDGMFGDVCADVGVAYISVFDELLGRPNWIQQVSEGDGAHPAAAGYQELAELIWPTWRTWITS